MFNDGTWVIKKLRKFIPEEPFEIFINGESKGKAKVISFAKRVSDTIRFPQVLVIYSSGYLRLKASSDPTPPLPFGQSLVLGPAISGTSTSYPEKTLFFHPQLKRIDIDTSQLNQNIPRRVLIRIASYAHPKRLIKRSTTNQIMDLNWLLTLEETDGSTSRLNVEGTYKFTEEVIPDPYETKTFESFRLLQISTMFIDDVRHDVNALQLHTENDILTLFYDSLLVNQLLPIMPRPLSSIQPMFDSIQTDGKTPLPNGNTPSYRIRINSITGSTNGPITIRAFFNSSQNMCHDNMGLWAFQQISAFIKKGTTGSINYTVIASANPINPDFPLELSKERRPA
ncbi:hypothetical protein [Nitrosomonas supralitoralis]|uniref:Uncharacterized protein n=1 Tax=Nitrosomonas supralitoralis TaxID=2116706 RepID=A0A2P7NRJ8_9PROT|nr:hypothetical protein [Nitrosomonas supralitoralis]PSJ16059.1 hypothetical protein C7H79_15620 [Nitrosomonas supralitoralis]